MAAFVLKDAEVIIDGYDLSDHVINCTLHTPTELLDASAMGVTAKQYVSGLIGWSLDITFKQDFDSGSVDWVLSQLVQNDTGAVVSVMSNKTNGVSSSNPKYSGTSILGSYEPVAGGVGSLATATCTLQSNGDLSRLTA